MGQVLDASSRKPIAGAIVNISGGPVAAVPAGPLLSGDAAAMPDAPRQILTDAEGHFLFRALAAGRYQIRATASGYLGGAFGQLRPGGSSQSIELTRDDEKRGDLSVRLWKTASISGTVVDESGEPLVSMPVRVILRTLVSGKPRYLPNLSATTDDRGFYRIANLAPGDYLIAVMSTQTTMPAATAEAYIQEMLAGNSSLNSAIYRDLTSSGAPYPGSGGSRVGDLLFQTGASGRGGGVAPPPADDGRLMTYPTQFYPAASVAAQATVLTLGSGEERTGIDLQLKLQPTVRVSGTITGPEGPAPNLGVKLLPAGADEFASTSSIEAAVTATDATGAFTFLGVTPGRYTLTCLRVPRPVSTTSAMTTRIEVMGANGMNMISMGSGGPSTAPPAPLPTELTLWATIPVTVTETDVAGLSVVLRPGGRISGRLVFDGSIDQPTPEQLQRASISINPIAGGGPVQMSSAAKRVETTGEFATVGYPAGLYRVGASLPPSPVLPGGGVWRFKSATLSGRDLSEDGLVVEGQDISGLVITFTDKTTVVTGTVTGTKGQPDPTAMVIVLPSDSQSWKQGQPSGRRVRSVRASTTGAFQIADLPPGSYYIAAISDDTLDNVQDPKTLEAISRVATRFTLGEGEQATQHLTTRSIR